MNKIPLTQGKFAIVDDEDYEELSKYKWHYHKNRMKYPGYAMRAIYIDGKQIILRMHRVILNISKNKQGDHINGNTLDNRRSNLRVCTQKENNWNASKRKDNTSGYKGVHHFKGKWAARIQVDNKRLFLGYYETVKEAAKGYDIAAKKYFDNYSKLNFPT